MSNLQIAALAYGATTLIYLAPTYIEGERVGGQWSAHRIAGLVLCLFWPVLTVIVIYKVAVATSKPKLVFIDHAATPRHNAPNRHSD